LGKRLVEDRRQDLRDTFRRGRIITSEDNAVGMQEIVDRAALPEELGARHDRQHLVEWLETIVGLLDRGAKPMAASDRNRALRHDDPWGAQMTTDLGCGFEDRRHVSVPTGTRRSPDTEKHDLRRLHCIADISGETQPSRPEALDHEVSEAWLIEGRLAVC
jgi:hypothetical protein